MGTKVDSVHDSSNEGSPKAMVSKERVPHGAAIIKVAKYHAAEAETGELKFAPCSATTKVLDPVTEKAPRVDADS